MRIVVLMHRGSAHGFAILRALAARGVAVTAVIETNGPSLRRLLRRTWADDGAAGVARGILRRLGRGLPAWCGSRSVDRCARAPSTVPCWLSGDTENGPRTLARLRTAAPDLLLLGGCGLLRSEVLSVPRLGTLNAHPGWLPDFRGTSVVAWALHEGDIPGATVHWVDPGLDTGDIVLRRRLPPARWHALREVEQAVQHLAAELAAEAVTRIAAGRAARTPQPPGGRCYPRMPANLRRALDARLRRGAADAVPSAVAAVPTDDLARRAAYSPPNS